MRLRPLLALLPFLALSTQAFALECFNPEALDQSTMNQCAYRDWEIADANLNDAYKAAMALLKQWDADLPAGEKGGATVLKEAQRAWITFRDKACEAEGYAMRGGSAEPLLVYSCMRHLTDERTNHLWVLVESYR
jgi:uncharacterized protein YecT (DUF1311 family)